MTPRTRIYLASQSPRRRELLKQIGINFETLLLRSSLSRRVDVDETPRKDESPEAHVQRVCQEKVNAGWMLLQFRNLLPLPVLAADTSVILDGKIIGKPQDREQAAATLRVLSGRQHQVLSAVAVSFEERTEMRLSISKVTMATLNEERIRRYILTSEPLDKAGAYGIQGHAAAFIQHIEGSYSGVMGLPLFETAELLKIFGYPTL
ncbi:nucleoside triphosphate pyrophosphatase YhdE [Candidatus Nitrotoga sp. BS]|uniref:Maf family protein n=1 Tax=Candidatus Nitrotoga sp. BS TaxID=2890408 RepID=UPI001EF39541|nr:nucleoside triphosphate pyrophosphatase [Candidatus Nitrotoga sp. BS]CAH1208538.1 nucleoside triphosphate pyrophosphatase YhdE [Candidatus Nitrotoga sp. BS]